MARLEKISRHGSKPAEFVGLSDQAINDIAYRLGDFFAGILDPVNKEQRLLKELWEVGDEEEKRVLTKMFARLCERDVDQG